MDTWQYIETLFHDIGNRDHYMMIAFYWRDATNEYGYSLLGPVTKDGEPASSNLRPDGSDPTPVFSTARYTIEEMWLMMVRAGKLLNFQEGRQSSDHDGARRFVALLVKNYGDLAREDRGVNFFANGARVCGMMAGKMCSDGE
jgi:hypothetical protein